MICRNGFEVILTNHAILKAKTKEIYLDMINATVKGGEIKRFGKNYIKFVKRYKKGDLICVGEVKEIGKIKIFTVEWG